ncbi:MAG: anti-sigma factor family protein [Phycisphaerae bacterium]
MNCKQVAEFLDRYLSGELPWGQRLMFDAHIALCRNCKNYIAGYRAAMKAAKGAIGGGMQEKEEALPGELVEAILRARQV